MKTLLSLPTIYIIFMLLASCGKDSPTSIKPDPTNPPDNSNLISKDIGHDGGSITSSDGLLTLSFPQGALNNTETISITRIETDELGTEFEAIDAEKAYDLGPDGLEFDVPLMVLFADDQDPNVGSDSLEVNSISLLSSENGEKVLLDSLKTTVDSDNGSVIGTGLLSHFSPLVKSSGALTLRIGSLPDTVEVSDSFFDVFVAGEVDLSKFDRDSVLLAAGPETPLEVEAGSNIQRLVLLSGAYIQNVRHRCREMGMGRFIMGIAIEADPVTGERGEFIQVKKEISCIEEIPTKFDLQIALEGTGSGVVFSDTVSSGTIYCPDSCSDEYFEGEYVILTAYPDEGSVFTMWSGDIGSNAPSNPIIKLTMDQSRSVTAIFEIKEPTEGFLQLGLFPLPDVLTNPETMVILGGPDQAFANFPARSMPALTQGAEGFVVIDLRNKEVLLDFTGLPNNGSVGERTPLGALAVSRPNPGSGTLSVIASYAQDNNNTEFGFNAFPYDLENQSFTKGPVSPFPSTIDAFPIGGNVVSDEIVIVREGGFGINFYRYNDISDEYQFRPSSETLGSNRYGFEQPVTAYGEEAKGPILVVNEPGDLYFEPRVGLTPTTLIGNLGQRIIRIRCKLPVCAATDKESGTIPIILWDGENQPSIIGDPIPVGQGAVDLDIYGLPNGNKLISTSSFSDNTFTQIEVDDSGNTVDKVIYDLPEDCQAPGHAIYANNPDDPNNPYIIGTCFDTNNYYINDRFNSNGWSFNAGIR